MKLCSESQIHHIKAEGSLISFTPQNSRFTDILKDRLGDAEAPERSMIRGLLRLPKA
mgnify:CR=1 FL=1